MIPTMSVSRHPELPVLLVDDDPAVLASETRHLAAGGVNNVLALADASEVLPLLSRTETSAVLLDISMPQIRGDALLEKIREAHPEVPVIMVTASADVETAVRCMKAGAFDYMVKAVEAARLVSGVERAIELRSLRLRYRDLRERLLSDELANPAAFSSIVTASSRMHAVFLYVESIAPTAETVLLTGETGTGKELLAEALHASSGKSGPLVKVNTAGLDDALFSDTLFGHVRGAFTGADAARKGLVFQAESGTLFLDEIGDLSPTSQVKLLRLIEAREYYPLGSDLARSTTARFVVATNQDLSDPTGAGAFRRDLYYRLQTHEVRIPPLRRRKEDLAPLVDLFLDQATRALGAKRLAVPPELYPLLETYDFPGNVRELRSMVMAAVSRQREKMLPLAPFREAMGLGDQPPAPSDLGALTFPDRLPTLAELTAQAVEEALRRSKGNQALAARLLGISPQALSARLARRRGQDGAEGWP
jgi:DNA-binding NtrC family response regulator